MRPTRAAQARRIARYTGAGGADRVGCSDGGVDGDVVGGVKQNVGWVEQRDTHRFL
jgi:hypothetical protein